jgi:tetratricopeptide (TPR) repeat protein
VKAETAYLFRHALLREAAYQLLLPEHRARLHELAIDALEDVLDQRGLDACAHEMAEHALYAQAVQNGGRQGWANREAHYLRRAAEYAQVQYRMDDAIRHWDRLSSHAALDARDRLLALNKAATARSNSGRLPDAERLLRAGIARGGDDAGAMARLHLSLGVTLYNTARVAEAAEQYRLALVALEAEGESETLARAHLNLGAAEEMLGRSDAAERCYSLAADIAHRAGDANLERHIIGNIGNLHHRAGRWPEAEREYLRALAMARAAEDLRLESAISTSVGIGHHEQGDDSRAAEYLHRAVEAARAAQDRYKLGDALVNLAIIDARPDNRAQTRRVHQEALEIHRETGNIWGEATALIGLSDVLIGEGKLEDAREVLLRARNLAAAVKDVDREGVSLLRLALVDLQDDQYERAAATWRHARAMLKNSRSHKNALHEGMLDLCSRKGVPPFNEAS